MVLGGEDFLRWFSQHILPKDFVRIRHYYLLSMAGRLLLRKFQAGFGITFPAKPEKKDRNQL
jgi:hypothetical protein